MKKKAGQEVEGKIWVKEAGKRDRTWPFPYDEPADIGI